MKLSVVIPAYNESLNLPDTLNAFYASLNSHHIDHELLVVNDNSSDNTEMVLQELQQQIPTLRYICNHPPLNGFGYAVRAGLGNYQGDCVAIVMADLSDAPEDLVKFYKIFVEHKVDCVFGSRFMKGGKVSGYPRKKYYINRFANNLVSFVFHLEYTDCTNAFKLYSRAAIEGLKPLLSPHFNLTLEMPLKAIVRGFSYKIVPNSWQNRKTGQSNLSIREMGSRYFFILLYCFIEKYFSKGDFKKKW
ncbi:glycosyltransferase family 2 protein [Segetibacter sp. 3557_3]|uniref:glycosyltransferase family 2 protein n=1 Tax=Segetibacter sp. 3557_3 TaxID=2547429 RepID=UPI001058F0BA|nr:glycosyltransferase family 2 protein [Segetibacter sp. 3557_3]TDH20812.1 glycosyltransferase family 2 protein [Segetibacter sp. 3557_3]